jgi:type IV pilus assembly protein PilA
MPARRQNRNRRSKLVQAGFSLVELLIVVAIIAILAGIVTPITLRARRTGNEASAIGSLRALNSAETTYAASAAKGGYATLLATLATACPGGSAAFISPDLAIDPAVKSGFTITISASTGAIAGPTDCNGTLSQSGYYTTAVPLAGGGGGLRAFASSETGTVFFDTSGVAPTEAAMLPGGGGTAIQ